MFSPKHSSPRNRRELLNISIVNRKCQMITFSTLFRFLSLVCILLCWPGSSLAKTTSTPVYTLGLSFELESSTLFATAKIEIPAGLEMTLDVSDLIPTGGLIQDASGAEKQLKIQGNTVTLPERDQPHTLYISYSKTVAKDRDNLIAPEGITLLDSWYPYPSHACTFTVSAELPKGFTAITESDTFPLPKESNIVTGHRTKPARNTSFLAGPYKVDKLKVRESLYVYSMFFAEDSALSRDYLQAAAGYIQQYEKEIGPFPYNHYVITANRLPTGYGMPTFTLLGQMVLRLPFIVDTSLGHEIVHSWFGNSVRVDYSEGNWCEGLTSFLADHRFQEDKGRGPEDRKESLVKYHSYVTAEAAKSNYTLSRFTSSSHSQQMAEYKRAIGYNGGAFFFHELRLSLGKDVFSRGVQKFYRDYRGKTASWSDIQKSFEEVTGKDLATFFLSRLQMKKAPALSAEKINVSTNEDGIQLQFTLGQDSGDPIPLSIPIVVKTMSRTKRVVEQLDTKSKDVSISLDDLPLEFTIDPEYDLLRTLTPDEQVAVWSRFLGAEKKLIILAEESQRNRYQPFVDALSRYEPEVVTADGASNEALGKSSIIFLGADQAPCRSIFGKVIHNINSTTIDVRTNPLNPEHVAVIISANDDAHNASIARRLSHYGKYSFLEFYQGRAVTKEISSSEKGLRFPLESLPEGGAVKDVSSFENLIDEVSKNRVIYVGETHNSYEDHLLQLRIIEALYAKHAKLAIGMEMFPASSQGSLDAYTQPGSTMDEATFLRESEYFDVWRFDYRLYRDILRFARSKQLKVLGLNLDRKIVSEVYRSGTTDTLDVLVKQDLVADRNLDMPGYQQRLSAIHGAHLSANHGSGIASGFIQAQALWDETMAANITDFLRQHPDYKVVVIAGNQHTRKDSGIPPRVATRLPIKQASLLNISGDAPDNIREIADYFFLAQPIELPESPKIGIVLSSEKNKNCPSGDTCLVIEEISPHGMAGKAGLKKGDVLLKIDNAMISDMTDLRIALMDRMEGDVVKIAVARGKNRVEHLIFDVELTVPGKNRFMPAGHP